MDSVFADKFKKRKPLLHSYINNDKLPWRIQCAGHLLTSISFLFPSPFCVERFAVSIPVCLFSCTPMCTCLNGFINMRLQHLLPSWLCGSHWLPEQLEGALGIPASGTWPRIYMTVRTFPPALLHHGKLQHKPKTSSVLQLGDRLHRLSSSGTSFSLLTYQPIRWSVHLFVLNICILCFQPKRWFPVQ